MEKKPLGIKNYGHIPHLPGSRMGPGDHKCHTGQARIATERTRDRHDVVHCEEKLDGSNVGVALVDGQIVALGRAGYLAQTSPHKQHQLFAQWVRANEPRFRESLAEGERIVGEWLLQAHGTRYQLTHEPFVAFDIMRGPNRLTLSQRDSRLTGTFTLPHLLSLVDPISVAGALEAMGEFGHHGALDPVEGAVWRVERHEQVGRTGLEREWNVDFLVKYVRPDKVDGCYLPETYGETVWNVDPQELGL